VYNNEKIPYRYIQDYKSYFLDYQGYPTGQIPLYGHTIPFFINTELIVPQGLEQERAKDAALYAINLNLKNFADYMLSHYTIDNLTEKDVEDALSALTGADCSGFFTRWEDSYGRLSVEEVKDWLRDYSKGQESGGGGAAQCGVEISPPSGKTAKPGETITYTFTVKNIGTVDDTYTLSAKSEHNWSVQIVGGSSVQIPANSSKNVDVRVTVSSNATDGSTDILTFIATSVGYANAIAEDRVTTTVGTGGEGGPPAGTLNTPPNASFEYSPLSPTVDNTVQFIDRSGDPDGTIVSWLWDFGDGETSISRNPTHRYSSPGNYAVSLTVTDNGGATGRAQQSLTIYPLPTASFRVVFTFRRPDNTLLPNVAIYGAPEGEESKYLGTTDSSGRLTLTDPSFSGRMILFSAEEGKYAGRAYVGPYEREVNVTFSETTGSGEWLPLSGVVALVFLVCAALVWILRRHR
jgi:PKD repeat protein